jgi:phosphatidylserine decarboxylase
MVRDGYWYGLPLLLVAGGLLGFWVYSPGVFFPVAGGFFLILALLVLNFFRDPERAIPSEPDAVVSPADGKIVEIREETAEKGRVKRVSIFMSPLDVHVNRSPFAGRIEQIEYRRGSFSAAYEPRASVENEQNVFWVRGAQGEAVVKQIAGAVARRIVFWKKIGDLLERGERVGMIKFGSRVDVLLEPTVEIRVEKGSRVRAGSSIIGFTRSRSDGSDEGASG